MKKIKFIHSPSHKHWVGNGFHVHSMFQPTPELIPSISPFLLMDFAPAEYFEPTSEKRGVGEHPHKGFETVTFVYQGEVSHKDSSGGGGLISDGDIQWMTAGKGIVHEEMHSDDFSKKGGAFEMVQLWVNLPQSKKLIPPRYQTIVNDDIKKLEIGEGEYLRVIAGEMGGVLGPADHHSPMTIFDMSVTKGSSHKLELKENTNTLLLVIKGKLNLNNQEINEKELAIFEREGNWLNMEVLEDSKILVLNGEPLNEPVFAYGPFVMTSREEVIEAFEEYQRGEMGRLNK